MELNLPNDLKKIIGKMTWLPNKIGRSNACVYQIISDQQRWYLKIQPYAPFESSLKKEKEILDWLQNKLPVPRAIYYKQFATNEFLLLSEVPGWMACDEKWRNQAEHVVIWLAKGLKMIHSIPIANCPFQSDPDKLIQEAYLRMIQGYVDENDFDTARLGKTATELFDLLIQTKPTTYDPVWGHGDYCLPNILISEEGIRGFIDWSRGGVTDRYFDLALAVRSITYNLGKKEYVPLFFQAYELENINQSKIEFYQLLDEFF
ncbi:APH(3') family aminoglycoside O-phosphotransferase [Thermoflavimicrobium daqui]|nr:APH(3') family aminoglycoside O-phosphotransferase [Thermoflavimicrobium daqui]